MAYILEDVHHLFHHFDEDSRILSSKDSSKDYIGLVDPGSMSPGCLSFLESLIQDNKQYTRIDQHQLQYDQNNKHLDFINEYGSNSLERLGLLETQEENTIVQTSQINALSNSNRISNKLFINTNSSYEIKEDFQNDFLYCDENLDYQIQNIDDREHILSNSLNTQSVNKNYNHIYEKTLHTVNSTNKSVNVPRKPRSNLKHAWIYKPYTTNYKDKPRRLRKTNCHEHCRNLSPRSTDILKRVLNKTLEKHQYINTILGINSQTLYELVSKKNDDEVGKLDVVVSAQPFTTPSLQPQSQEPNSPIDGFSKDFKYLISELSDLGFSPSLNEVDVSMFDIDTSIFDLNIPNFDNIYSDTSSHFDPYTSNFDLFDSLNFKNHCDRSETDEVEENTRIIDDEARFLVELDDRKASQELEDAYVTSTSKVLELYNPNLTNICETLEPKVPLSISTIEESLPSHDSKANGYILNEDECRVLFEVTSKKNLSHDTNITNAPNQEKFLPLNITKIKSIQGKNTLFKSKCFKLNNNKTLSKIIEAQNKSMNKTIQGLNTNTTFEVGSNLKSINNNRWQNTQNSAVLDIALTYMNKPIPLEWKNMEDPHLIGVCMSIFSNLQKVEAWNIMHNNQNNIDTSKVNIWNPQLYMDNDLKTYNRYFPIVVNTSTKKVLAFDYRNNEDIDDIGKDYNQKGWTIMPSLEWIKSPIIARVIAANDGLIVLDSKKAAISTIQINYKWVFYETQKLNKYVDEKDQSLLTIINPLTHEYMFLPPIPFNVFKKKIGYLSFSNAKDQNYRLFILGCEEIKPTIADIIEHAQKDKKKIPKRRPIYTVNFAIYSSIDKTWNHFDHFEHTKTNHFHSTGGYGNCAVINYRFYFGGIQVIPCPEKTMDDEVPSIFYINCEKSRYQHLTRHFLLHGIGNIRIPEAPKLVKVNNNRIYAITREATLTTKKHKNVVIVEVLLDEDGTPNGKYALVVNGIMPEACTLKLFKNPWQKGIIKYEVYSSGDLIAFRVSQPQFVIYDVNKTTWRLICLPLENTLEGNAKKNYLVVQGVYQPNWLATTLKDQK